MNRRFARTLWFVLVSVAYVWGSAVQTWPLLSSAALCWSEAFQVQCQSDEQNTALSSIITVTVCLRCSVMSAEHQQA